MSNSALVHTDPQDNAHSSSSGENPSALGRVAVLRSRKRLARIAGLLYLTVAVFGAFAHALVRGNVYAPGDAAATAEKVLANDVLIRLGVVADLFQVTVFVFLAMTLSRLLRHASRNAASTMVVLVAIDTAIVCLNMVFQFAGLLIATEESYVRAFGTEGASALVLLMFDMQHYGYLIAQIFFGLWLFPLGYLVSKSGMFPKLLGILLIAGGACYLVGTLAEFLVPTFAATINGFIYIPPLLAEVWILLYLLVKGVRPSPHR
jgi:hypothetical protein